MAKQLFRSNQNCVIAGVCGGLGEFFDVDPIFFRVIFVIATIYGGLGLLVYIALWVMMPKGKLM